MISVLLYVTALTFRSPLIVCRMLFEGVCKLLCANACLGLVPEMHSPPTHLSSSPIGPAAQSRAPIELQQLQR